jgi:hypothetical protein
MTGGRPGTGKKQTALLAQELARALKRAAPEMAYMFYQSFSDLRKTKAMKWIIGGYIKQLVALGVALEDRL